MIEVETKYHLADKQTLVSELQKLGFEASQPLRQVDKVFLVNSESFATFTPGDPVARIRSVNGQTSLTLKRTINSDGDTIEHEMAVDPASAAEGLLTEMGYKAVTNVDKVRLEYKRDDITVAIDEVAELGQFVEIEVISPEGEETNAREKVEAIADRLGLAQGDIVTKKYDQLLSELRRN